MVGLETYTSHGIGIRKKVEVLPLFGSTTSGTPRMQWTPWMGQCLMGANCECRWPAMDALQILITVAAEDHPGGTVATVDEAEASPPAHDAGGAAVPEVEAVHAVAHATADQGPGRTPGPGPAPSPAHPAGASLNLRPDPVPGPSQSPSPALGAGHLRQTENPSPDQDRRALPNLPRRKGQRPNGATLRVRLGRFLLNMWVRGFNKGKKKQPASPSTFSVGDSLRQNNSFSHACENLTVQFVGICC